MIYKYLNELWDELITKHFSCSHEECPYKDCMWHMYSTKPYFVLGEDIPIYMPTTRESMESCMSYMDI